MIHDTKSSKSLSKHIFNRMDPQNHGTMRLGDTGTQNASSLNIKILPVKAIKAGWIRGLSVSQIVLSILTMTFQLGAVIDKSGIYFIGAGIWAGSGVSIRHA